jgi:hypothetical protein
MTNVIFGRTYEKNLNHELLNDYINKYNIENIFDKDILKLLE